MKLDSFRAIISTEFRMYRYRGNRTQSDSKVISKYGIEFTTTTNETKYYTHAIVVQ